MSAVHAQRGIGIKEGRPSGCPKLTIRSGAWELLAEGDSYLPLVIGAREPKEIVSGIAAAMSERQRVTGRSQLVCGLLPFDSAASTALFVTDRARWRLTPPLEPYRNNGYQLAAPEDRGYRSAVCDALQVISGGEIDKVVLARQITLPLERPLDQAVLFNRLAAVNRAGDTFSATAPDGTTWIGASPELVAEVRCGEFSSHPLAGSVPRGNRFPDAVSARSALLGSAKDLAEHEFVVNHIVAGISPVALSVRTPARPEVFGTDSMWHLGTRITAQLRPGVGALESALLIHPTPAVCGTPTARAAELIAKLEPLPRSHYAGLVGWADSSGNGRWSLVLRCAEVRSRQVRLFAGAGIVAGSDPEAEHAETAAKFVTMLRALQGL